MCVRMTVVCFGRRLQHLNNVMFVGKVVGLTKTLKKKRFLIKCYDTFFWHLDCRGFMAPDTQQNI